MAIPGRTPGAAPSCPRAVSCCWAGGLVLHACCLCVWPAPQPLSLSSPSAKWTHVSGSGFVVGACLSLSLAWYREWPRSEWDQNMTPTQGCWLVPSSGRADSGKEGRLRPPLVWAPSPCWDPAARTPRGLQEGMGPGTQLHTRRACASCSELCPVPPRQGNCTLELQSDCLAQQLNAREMEQKAATSHWPRPCRESGMHTCPGRAWLCAHAHVLTLTLSVSGCTVLTSAARPYL